MKQNGVPSLGIAQNVIELARVGNVHVRDLPAVGLFVAKENNSGFVSVPRRDTLSNLVGDPAHVLRLSRKGIVEGRDESQSQEHCEKRARNHN